MNKALLVATILLQFLLALSLNGWPRSVAELSAFLLVAALAWQLRQPNAPTASSETSSI